MNIIQKAIEAKKANNEKALITFVTAGYPTKKDTKSLVLAMEAGGADVIEIGIPYSDPLADGPVIQSASGVALENGITVKDVMEIVTDIRTSTEVPLVYLVYFNTIYIYGMEQFIQDAENAGINGLIIPDLPMEERDEFMDLLKQSNVVNIPLVAPTSKDRIKAITNGGGGFVYSVSSLGVTGRGSDFHSELETYMNEVASQTTLPVAIGFGIKTKDDIDRLSPLADALIVGTKVIEVITESNADPETLKSYIQSLK